MVIQISSALHNICLHDVFLKISYISPVDLSQSYRQLHISDSKQMLMKHQTDICLYKLSMLWFG